MKKLPVISNASSELNALVAAVTASETLLYAWPFNPDFSAIFFSSAAGSALSICALQK
jgi:hypothetical protein